MSIPETSIEQLRNECFAIREATSELRSKVIKQIATASNITFYCTPTWFEEYDDQSTTEVFVAVELSIFRSLGKLGELQSMLPEEKLTFVTQIFGGQVTAGRLENRGREVVALLLAAGAITHDEPAVMAIIEQNADTYAALKILNKPEAKNLIDAFFASALILAKTASLVGDSHIYVSPT